jgi:hypothetical protein
MSERGIERPASLPPCELYNAETNDYKHKKQHSPHASANTLNDTKRKNQPQFSITQHLANRKKTYRRTKKHHNQSIHPIIPSPITSGRNILP